MHPTPNGPRGQAGREDGGWNQAPWRNPLSRAVRPQWATLKNQGNDRECPTLARTMGARFSWSRRPRRRPAPDATTFLA